MRFSNSRDSSSEQAREGAISYASRKAENVFTFFPFLFAEAVVRRRSIDRPFFIRPRASSAFIRYKEGNIVSQRELRERRKIRACERAIIPGR